MHGQRLLQHLQQGGGRIWLVISLHFVLHSVSLQWAPDAFSGLLVASLVVDETRPAQRGRTARRCGAQGQHVHACVHADVHVHTLLHWGASGPGPPQCILATKRVYWRCNTSAHLTASAANTATCQIADDARMRMLTILAAVLSNTRMNEVRTSPDVVPAAQSGILEG